MDVREEGGGEGILSSNRISFLNINSWLMQQTAALPRFLVQIIAARAECALLHSCKEEMQEWSTAGLC
jgi:hypothetical protein